MTKLLVFIDPEKFKNLMLTIPVGYEKVNPDGSERVEWLGGTDILCVSESGCLIMGVGDINGSNATIFIIPDGKIEQVNVSTPYKILYHHNTIENYQIPLNLLIEKSVASKLSQEDTNTVYGKLAKLVNDNQITIEKINAFIDLILDDKLEAQLNLLHQCLMPTTTPANLEGNEWSALKPEDKAFFKVFSEDTTKGTNPFDVDGNYIKSLTTLRTSLLGE